MGYKNMTAIIVFIFVLVVVVGGTWSSITAPTDKSNFEIALGLASNILGALAVLASTYQWLHSHNLKFYLWIQRQRHKWFPSKSSTWDIQAKWQGNGGEDSLAEFEKWLKSHYSGEILVWKQVKGLRSYQVDGRFNIESSYEVKGTTENDSSFLSVLRIYALTVNFSESKDIMNKDVIPLLHKMIDLVRPIANEQAYNLTMNFTGKQNPFIGLYIQGLHPQEIKQFQIVVSPHMYDKETTGIVRVSPGNLSISTHSIREFEMMATDFLSFAPSLAKPSK
jgi:hypothetical protein